MEAPGFWDDAEKAQKYVLELNALKSDITKFSDLHSEYEDLMTLIEMGFEENDQAIVEEVESEYNKFISDYESLKISTLLSDEYDGYGAILTLHAGAGGTESCDWTEMLSRMYRRYADKKGFGVEILDFLVGDEAGMKSVTMQINGQNAFGYLKSEKGVHRLVRISPFNAAGKRQTSFASCDVMPDIEEDLDIEKTSSAVRITHLPTGIVVQCQNERSQFQNKDKAMQMLKAKLYLLKKEANAEKISDIRGEVKEINFGNQIRSYVMQPYTMVKDHRTNFETGNVGAVLDGDLDPFIIEYLKWKNLKK